MHASVRSGRRGGWGGAVACGASELSLRLAWGYLELLRARASPDNRLKHLRPLEQTAAVIVMNVVQYGYVSIKDLNRTRDHDSSINA